MITADQIREIADLAKKAETKPAAGSNGKAKPARNGGLSYRRLDVARYLQARGVEFRIKDVDGGLAYLVRCPFNDAHGSNGESAVIQASSGLLTFECKHNSCQGRRWADYRDAIGAPDPEHWNGTTGQHTKATSQATTPQAGADGQQTTEGETEAPERPRCAELIDTTTLLGMDLRPRFLVKNVLVAGQPCVVGGRSKTLKTSIALDLAISLASETEFLKHFKTTRARVGVWSAESGAGVLRETAQRVAQARGVVLRDCPIYWCFAVPQLSRDDHLQALADAIAERSIDVAIIDPLYLALLTPELAAGASNIFAMGSALLPLSEIGQQTGATIIVLHHFRKTGTADPDEPAALEELAQSGVAEWARQWILLARRQPYQADGNHQLWLRAGGSAGHAGLYALDIAEGVYDPETADGGRRWDVTVRQATEARAEARRDRENRKAAELAERDQDDCRRMLEAVRRVGRDGDTERALRELSGLSKDRTAAAIRVLLGEQRVERIEIKKHTRVETAYRVKNR